MRAIWKGAVSFGLVTIPIKLYAATESKEMKFNYLHDTCKTPIRYEKVCPACGREVTQEEIVRGYEYERGKYVVIRDEDLEHLPLETIRSVQIIDFVRLAEIDPIYFIKSYYLAPEDLGVKAYRLLYQAMEESQKVAVAKVVLRAKENLAVLRIYQGCLMMSTMFYSGEVRPVAQMPMPAAEVRLQDREMEMAKTLVENLTADFQPEKYTSAYREALIKMIDAKIADEEIAVPRQPETTKVIDLVEALRASLEATRSQADGQAQSKAESQPQVKAHNRPAGRQTRRKAVGD